MKYQVTVGAESLPELIGALTEAASVLQAGDAAANAAIGDELMQYAAVNGGAEPPLPIPPPDYQAAGLTEYQAMQARAAAAQPVGVAVAPAPAVTVVAPPAAAPGTGAGPACSIHQLEMVWKGGGISPKSGKGLPLWSCPRNDCREAIWPPR